MSRRWEVLAPSLGLGTVVAAALLLHGLQSYSASEAHLDRLVEELGEALTRTAATSIRATNAVLAQLDAEIRDSVRLKAAYLDRATVATPHRLQRFAFAARLRHVFVFDEHATLVAQAREFPDGHRDSELGHTPALFDAVRKLAESAGDQPRLEEIRVAPNSEAPWIAYVSPLASGGTAVLVQDTSAFASTRSEAEPGAVAERLERETPITFVRFNSPAPDALDPAIRTFEHELDQPAGTLRIGLDTSSMRDALAIQLRSTLVSGAILWIALVLGAVLVFRLRRSRADLSRRIEHEERLSGLGRLAANIAHEVRNPLNAIGIASQRLERRPDLTPDTRRLAKVVSDEVLRLDRTVTGVLQMARPGAARSGPVQVQALMETVVALAQAEAEQREVRLDLRDSTAIELRGDTDLLRGALWNLVRNAVRASPVGSSVTLRATQDGREVAIAVMDEGAGLPPGDSRSLFEPFRSGERGGSGLGLALALSAAQAHGGTIEAHQRTGGGSTFRMRLPFPKGTA